MVGAIESLGAWVIFRIIRVGLFMQLLIWGIIQIFRPPWRIRLTFKQLEFVGVQSLTIVVITGFFTGAVFTLQAHYGFALFGAEGLTGSTVALSLGRELGPCLAALMVAGRAGSAMAAEIASMKVTEQIDALEAMAVDPIDYLVAPRLIAGVLMVPVLTAVFDVVGMYGSYLTGVYVKDINEGAFIYRIQWYLDPDDVLLGLAKAAVFGFLVALIGCYKGLHMKGGAEGVGRATTEAVVMSSITVLIVDYFLTLWWMT